MVREGNDFWWWYTLQYTDMHTCNLSNVISHCYHNKFNFKKKIKNRNRITGEWDEDRCCLSLTLQMRAR